jgi:hypothetical protein
VKLLPRYHGRVGPLITAVGVVHVATTPVFFPASVRGIVEDRVVGALSAEDPAVPVRAAGFWYAISGVAVAALGAMTGYVERRGEPLPTALPAALAGLGVVGVVLDQRSGFWVFFPLAALARAGSARPARRSAR